MKVEVMRRHIDKGVEASPRYCPIARALTEQLGLPCAVTEGKAWNLSTGEVLGVLPDNVRKLYIKYDHFGVMNPFEFDLGGEEMTLSQTA